MYMYMYMYTCNLAYMYMCVDGAASPEHYRQFMAILCGYIVEKQREVQGEELPFDLVFVSYYTTIYQEWCTQFNSSRVLGTLLHV